MEIIFYGTIGGDDDVSWMQLNLATMNTGVV
mgnify:CR=1 FL=1